MNETSLYRIYSEAKNHGLYPVANLAFALANSYSAKVRIETQDKDGTSTYDSYYDLVVIVLPTGETMCIPTPLLNTLAVASFYKKGEVCDKMPHRREVVSLNEEDEAAMTYRLLGELLALYSESKIEEALELLNAETERETTELVRAMTGALV